MILVDSSVWIDYFRGQQTAQTDKLHALLGDEPVAIGDIILTEVLQGFGSDAEFEWTRQALSALTLVTIGGADVAVQAALHFRTLRALGVTVRKTIDTLIATRCLIDGLPLLFSDRDFEPFVRHLGLIQVS